jgi:hypothetical protein
MMLLDLFKDMTTGRAPVGFVAAENALARRPYPISGVVEVQGEGKTVVGSQRHSAPVVPFSVHGARPVYRFGLLTLTGTFDGHYRS